MDTVFKALADPTRRTLLDRLHAENGQSLSKLCEYLGMSRQAVTQHLEVLEQAELVVVVWRGREKLHYLNPLPIQEIYDRWISKYERHRLQALSDLKRQLETDTELATEEELEEEIEEAPEKATEKATEAKPQSTEETPVEGRSIEA